MHRKKIVTAIPIAFFLSLSQSAFSQQAINASSHTASIHGMQFDYSIGEMTLVSTERNAGLVITQGLLQPNGPGSGANQSAHGSALAAADQLKVYPNPTENFLIIESLDKVNGEMIVQLFDASGKLVLSEKKIRLAGPNKVTLDLRSFAAGAYYLMLQKITPEGQPENLSFKIQKVN